MPAPRFPKVATEWSTLTSSAHWVPSPERRAEIAELIKAGAKQPRAKQKATWEKACRLLPRELAAIVGGAAASWTSVASSEVAAVAMEIITYAGQPGADVERAQRELERILPDVPMVSLDGVVDGPRYIAATDAIDRTARSDPRLARLQLYLSSS